MAPRPSWKGYLKLSLVSCAVNLYPATTKRDRVHFHIINRKTGNRVRYEVLDAQTGREVRREDRVKGYKGRTGKQVLLEDEELDQVALESTKSIDVEAFVPRAEVDELFLDESFYIVPADEAGVEAYTVIRKAIEKEELVGISRVVMRRREQLLMLRPRGKGILATTLRYRDEVRDEHEYLDDIPAARVSPDMIDLAIHILKSKITKFDPAKFEDRYETAVKKLIAAKRAGKEPPAPPEEVQPSNVISLMDALRRSVKEKKGARTRAARKRSPAKHKKLKRAS